MSCSLARWLYSLPAGILRMRAHALSLFLFGAILKSCQKIYKETFYILELDRHFKVTSISYQIITEYSWHPLEILRGSAEALADI